MLARNDLKWVKMTRVWHFRRQSMADILKSA